MASGMTRRLDFRPASQRGLTVVVAIAVAEEGEIVGLAVVRGFAAEEN